MAHSQEFDCSIPSNFFDEEFEPLTQRQIPPSSPLSSQESSFNYSPDPSQLKEKSPSWSPTSSSSSLSITMTTSDFQKEIDPESELALWAFYDDKDTDKIVKEYVDLIEKNRFFPRVPDQSRLEDLPQPAYQLSKECSKNVVSVFTDYFQSRYFCKNTKGAIDSNYAMASVHVNFQVPQYNQMPEKVFKDTVHHKDVICLAMQTNYCEGQLFVCELNLLRVYDFIITEVKTHVNTDAEVEKHTEYFFLTHYVASKTNFIKNYNIKVIDWTQKPRKNKILLPFWRKKEGGSPPKFRENRYASALMKVINEGKAKLDSVNVLKEFANCPPQKIKKKPTPNISQKQEGGNVNHPQKSSSGGFKYRNFHNHDHRRAEYNDSRRKGNKSKQERKRGGNQQIDANREKFINDNVSSDSDSQADIPKNFLQ